ncbi:PQQ-dependent sugar dehydrogenase, partial [Pontibacter korlensis]
MNFLSTMSVLKQSFAQAILLVALFLPSTSFGQLPTQFNKVELLTGLKNSVNFEFAPDGRIFIIDRYGEILIYKPAMQTTVSAGTVSVFHDMEDGLLGIAFDPQFLSNQFVYLHYSHETLAKNRVSRFVMIGDQLDLSSEVVMLEWTSDRNGYYHAAGDMDFDSKGNLYIAIGDNTNHTAYAPLNEVDPNQSAERTSSNTNDLRGKILRIKPEPDGTYSIPEGNLFPNGVGGRAEIYVMGARNPYKIFVDKTNTDWLFWGEVGPDANTASDKGPEGMDEINITKSAGNYGWPYFSGNNEPYLNTYAQPNFYYDHTNPLNLSKWNTGPQSLPPAQPSWLNFFHECYLVGPRYYFDSSLDNPKKLPSDFNQAFFYYDFNTSKIWVSKMDLNGNLTLNEQFAADIITGAGFIDLKIGPDGQLYILEYGVGCCPNNVGSGKLVRVDYIGIDTNKPPQVTLTTDVVSGALPLNVNFSSDGTIDPEGNTLTFAWDFESDGIVDSNEKNPSYTYSEKGNYDAQLRVTDSNGASSSKSIKIYAGNHAATFQFVSPLDGGLISWEDNLDYNIVVNDAEDGSTKDGTIDCSALNLIPSFGHNTHSHDGFTINQCAGSFYLDPTSHDAQGQDDIFYVFKVNYTDSEGLTSFDQVTVHPKLMEAEFYDLQLNTRLYENTDKLGGGLYSVRALSHDSYVMLEGRNLHNINSVSYRVASTVGGVIEIHADSPEGTLISTVKVPVTGSLDSWTNASGSINNPGGKHDLYFVFKNIGAINLFDLNYIEFIGSGVSSDITPPNVYSVTALSKNQIGIKFNEPLDEASAEQVGAYSLDNNISIYSASLLEDKKTVMLSTSTMALQVENQLTINSSLKNESGIALSQNVVEYFTLNEVLVRINAGGPEVTLDGVQWQQHKYNSGGSISSQASTQEISNTISDAIYQTEVNGIFSYSIPVPQAGKYDVKLHFAETYYKKIGERVFNVDVENGQKALANYDIIAKAGFATAVIEVLNDVSVEDGYLTLTFRGVVNKAKLSAIEVLYAKDSGQEPSIILTSPLNNTSVAQPFDVNFKVNYWAVGSRDSHIHKIVDGIDRGDITTISPTTFSDLAIGTHTIKLVLANADHSLTDYSDEIQVKVVEELICADNPFPLKLTEHIIGSDLPYRSPYIFEADLNGDGYEDIVTGGWWYRNPGALGGEWKQNVIGAPMNNMVLLHDFDKDGDIDIFGTQGKYTSSLLAWAQNDGKGNFITHTNIPAGADDSFIAGATIGNFDGVENTQLVITWNGAEVDKTPVQMLTIPADPVNEPWTIKNISPNAVGESITAGDIDNDGDLDLFQSKNWLRNDNGSWAVFSTGIVLPTNPERNALVDLNKDGILDAIVTQSGADQEIYWFQPSADPTKAWTKHTVGTDVDGGLSLDVIDFDFDGDLDVITGEWRNEHRLIAFENDLCITGTWIKHILHPGGTAAPDHHDGTQTVDIDNDGDLDIISVGWDKRTPRIYYNDGSTMGNTSPVVSNPIPDQSATVGTAFSFTFPETTFSDADGDALAYA